MKKFLLLLAAVWLVQALPAQPVAGDYCDPADLVTNGLVAPLFVFTNGPGRVYAFATDHDRRGREEYYPVQAGDLLPVGSHVVLLAVPERGYQLTNWYPVNVFSDTEITYDAEGQPTTSTIITQAPIPQPIKGGIREVKVPALTVLLDVPGVRTISTGSGWQANFAPLPPPPPRRR